MSRRLWHQRNRARTTIAAAIMLAAFTSCLFAKDKMEPVPQWALDAAKIPTPANEGDAKAVVLSDEYLITLDAFNQAVERERSAVRILKQQGREYAQCGVDYDVDSKLNY